MRRDARNRPPAATGATNFARRLVAYGKHVAEKVGTVTLGAVFVSSPAQTLRAYRDKIAPPVAQSSIKAALLAHVYYPELLPEILACWRMFPHNAPLYITTTPDRAEIIRQAIAGERNARLYVEQNRGRDIAPFLKILASDALDEYDAVLKLHTKASPHLWDGSLRRKLLFQSLCGSRRSAEHTLALFENPATGMVGWAPCFRATPRFWFANEARVRALADRMRASGFVRPGFFEGSMFWFRPAALKRLKALNLSVKDFEPEARQLDGALHHAIERLFTIAAWADGFTVRDLGGRLLPRE